MVVSLYKARGRVDLIHSLAGNTNSGAEAWVWTQVTQETLLQKQGPKYRFLYLCWRTARPVQRKQAPPLSQLRERDA